MRLAARTTVLVSLCAAIVLAAGADARADFAAWQVATVHGTEQFSISADGSTLTYFEQGWTSYVWYNNNGSPPDVIAQGMYGDRTGMKTYAMTDVAAGAAIKDVKFVYEYYAPGGSTYGYPSMNFYLTDGAGTYGIFSPASKGFAALTTTTAVGGDWYRVTFDFPTINTNPANDAVQVAIYEHNGLSADYVEPYTTMQWGDIKDLAIAGTYDYMRSPTGGWGAWGTQVVPVNQVGVAGTVNGYGISLNWGDTVNSNNVYGSRQRIVRTPLVTLDGTDYVGTFENATIPAPASVMAGVTGLAMLGTFLRRRRQARGSRHGA